MHAPAYRKEDRRLVTGRGLYTADRAFPGELYGYFLRSDRAHAELLKIDTAAARARCGVHGVFTAADSLSAGMTHVVHLLKLKGSDGEPPLNPPHSAFAHGRVRFVGEPIALVVAESASAAQDAAEAIAIEYHDLQPVIDAEAALAPGAPLLHQDVPGNLAWEFESGNLQATEQAFAAAAHVTRLRLDITRVIPNPLEPRCCIVEYDAATDHYDVYTVIQGITMMRMQLAFASGVREDQLTIHARDVGGSFGSRAPAYPEYSALLLAAKALGRPVKWIGTRSECIASDHHGRSNIVDAELALDGDGRFLALRVDWVADMGAWLTAAGTFSHTYNASVLLSGVYRIPALYGHWRNAMTNTSPIGAYRGAGRPDVLYVVERLVDEAAAQMKMDRAEIRRRNLIPLDAFPYTSATGTVYEVTDLHGTLEKALALAGWHAFESRRAQSRARGKLRGIGMAAFIEHTSRGFFPKDQIDIEVTPDGVVHAYSVSQTAGQGHETTFAMIIADAMGVALDRVLLHQSPSERPLVGTHSGGSRTTVGVGNVCRLAALKLIELAKSAAAEELGTEPSQVDYERGVLTDRTGGGTLALEDLAARAQGLRTQAEATFGSTFPAGCHIAEVEIDPETGSTEILSYVAVDDCGVALNHAIVEGQMHGGIVQGAGQVFGEQVIYDRQSGQLLTGSFMDYQMPRSELVRRIVVDENCTPSKANPLGVKGVGEAGCTGSIPCLANAMVDALRMLGISQMDMPFTPNAVWHAIDAAGGVK